MNAKETRQFEMLLRVRDFVETHRDLFTSVPAANTVCAAVDAAVAELAATDVMKMSAAASARAARKAAARERILKVLQRASRAAKILRTKGRTTPPFRFPESRSDQTLLTAARQFARAAAALEADFTAHGMSPAHISGVAAAFDEAIRDCAMSRSEYIAARARIQQLLVNARLDVRRIGLMVRNEGPGDQVIHAVWKQAHRIEEKRRRPPRPTAATPAPISAAEA